MTLGIMKEWLKQIWRYPAIQEAMHPELGKLELSRVRGKESWDGEVAVDGQSIGAYFKTANAVLPTENQIAFFRSVTRNQESTFTRAAPKLVPCYESMYGRLSGSWCNTFKLVGVEVPLDANDQNPWLLQFEGKTHRFELYTVHFSGGFASDVSCDS
jgi:hypothetical protein